MKIVLLTAIFTLGGGVKLPPNFRMCNRQNQVDLDDCILKAARYAISQLTHPYNELNIPNLEPFKLLESSISGGSGPVTVNQKFKNCNLYGLTQFQMDEFRFDFDKKTLTVNGTFPEVRMECDYQVTGKVLIIPVNGVGNSTIILENIKVSSLFQYEEGRRKGKTYIKFTSGDVTMDPDRVNFDFLNHKDRRLSDHLNPVLNENWKEIFSDVKSDYIEIIKQIILNLLNGFFSKVSMEEALDG